MSETITHVRFNLNNAPIMLVTDCWLKTSPADGMQTPTIEVMYLNPLNGEFVIRNIPVSMVDGYRVLVTNPDGFEDTEDYVECRAQLVERCR